MRRGIFMLMVLLGAVSSVSAVALWWPFSAGGLAGAVSAVPQALVFHGLGALLFAIGVSGLSARRLVAFYFVIALALPVLGMLTVCGLSRILDAASEAIDDGDELDVGNPILGRPGGGEATAVYLKPIARMMREEDAAGIGRMILGLSQSRAVEQGYQILRRYQQDRDVELQFYAQSALRGAGEGLEAQMKTLTRQLAENPQDGAVRRALAEVLIALAGQRTTSSSDVNAYVRRAFGHLKQLPASARRAALEVRGYLLVREPAGARAALEGLPARDLRRPRLEAEVLYAERDWARLEEFVGGLETSDLPLRMVRSFWRRSV